MRGRVGPWLWVVAVFLLFRSPRLYFHHMDRGASTYDLGTHLLLHLLVTAVLAGGWMSLWVDGSMR